MPKFAGFIITINRDNAVHLGMNRLANPIYPSSSSRIVDFLIFTLLLRLRPLVYRHSNNLANIHLSSPLQQSYTENAQCVIHLFAEVNDVIIEDQMQQEILKRVDVLSAKLGVGAQVLYGMYLRQSYIDGWECVAGAILSLIVAYVLLKLLGSVKGDDTDILEFLLAAGIFCALGSAGTCIFNAVDFLANPGMWAFQELARAIRF